jgi:hypothetical protein
MRRSFLAAQERFEMRFFPDTINAGSGFPPARRFAYAAALLFDAPAAWSAARRFPE